MPPLDAVTMKRILLDHVHEIADVARHAPAGHEVLCLVSRGGVWVGAQAVPIGQSDPRENGFVGFVLDAQTNTPAAVVEAVEELISAPEEGDEI